MVPDKHVQPVCLKTIFFTIDSLINTESSGCVILGGSVTRTNVGFSLLFKCNVAFRFWSVGMFSSFQICSSLTTIAPGTSAYCKVVKLYVRLMRESRNQLSNLYLQLFFAERSGLAVLGFARLPESDITFFAAL